MCLEPQQPLGVGRGQPVGRHSGELGDHLGQLVEGHDLETAALSAGAGEVEHGEGLVRQPALGHIAVREPDRGLDRLGSELDAVVLGVALGASLDDLQRLVEGRLLDVDPGQPPLEAGVRLDVAAVGVGGGGEDAGEIAAGHGRAQLLSALARATAGGGQQRVDLVEEQHHSALEQGDLVAELADALAQSAAHAGAGDQVAHVDLEHRLALEPLELTGVEPLGQPLDDRRLAHPGLAHETGDVAPPPVEGVDDPLELELATDERIELTSSGGLGQVTSQPLEQRRLLVARRGQRGGAGRLLTSRLAQRLAPILSRRRRRRRRGALLVRAAAPLERLGPLALGPEVGGGDLRGGRGARLPAVGLGRASGAEHRPRPHWSPPPAAFVRRRRRRRLAPLLAQRSPAVAASGATRPGLTIERGVGQRLLTAAGQPAEHRHTHL